MPKFNKRSIAGLKHYPNKRGGWMSPEGDYYPAPYKTHDAITHLLAMAYYGKDKAGRRILEEAGWVLVKHDGVVWFHPRNVTSAQAAALVPLLKSAPDDNYHANMLKSINDILNALDADAI